MCIYVPHACTYSVLPDDCAVLFNVLSLQYIHAGAVVLSSFAQYVSRITLACAWNFTVFVCLFVYDAGQGA